MNRLARFAWRRLLFAVAIVTLAYAVMALLAGLEAAAAARDVAAAQQELGGVLHGQDLAGVSRAQVAMAGRRLDRAAAHLQRDQRALAPLFGLAPAVSWAPYVGRPLGDAPNLLALADDAAAGGAALTHGIDPLLAETEGGDAPPLASPAAGNARQTPVPDGAGGASDTTAPAARLVSALAAGAPALRQGDLLLNGAEERRARLHPQSYRGPFALLRRRVQQLDADLPSAVQDADALALLPDAAGDMLGFDGPRTYVVLGQDSAEIRPSGGFIGSAGLVTLINGRLVFQEYRSSYDFDSPNVPPLPPPAPLTRYLGAGAWLLRDANWSPDFPTTAKQVEAFVRRDTGVQADGVIAFDNAAVSDLLAALGPLQVQGFDGPVTADNWFDLTTRGIFTDANALLGQVQDYQQAKGSGLGAVLQVALAKAQSARGSGLIAVVEALRRASLGSHLQLSFDDQRAAEWARTVHGDGALFPPPDGDVVTAVDANLGYSKVGPYVQRQLQYEVWLDAHGNPQRATLTLSLENAVDAATVADPQKRIGGLRWLPGQGTMAPAPGIFADYLRLYLAAGAAVTHTSGLPELTASDDGGYRVLSGFIPLEPQQTQTVTAELGPPAGYRAPAPNAYELSIVKQAGIDVLPVTVTVHLAPDTHAVLLPPDAEHQGGSIVLHAELRDAVTRFVYVIAAAGRS